MCDNNEKSENKCKGIFGKLFGHNYCAIFEEYVGPTTFTGDYHGVRICEALEKYREVKHTYVHSICSRCGDVIQKTDGQKG